jgi:DNA-directed RNA polymerase specialized sigma24 family protein
MPIRVSSPRDLWPSLQQSWYQQFAVRFDSLRKERTRERARQRAKAPSFKVLESLEFRAKVAFEVRDWCLRNGCPHLGDDLIQDSLVHIAEQLPDYRPGVASAETWVLAKSRSSILHGFLNNYRRGKRFKNIKKTVSVNSPSGELEDGEALTALEAAEYQYARGEDEAVVRAQKRALTNAAGFIRRIVRSGNLKKRDARVWLYRHGWGSRGRQQAHDAVAEYFGLTSVNVRKIVERASTAIRSELKSIGLVAPGRILDPGYSGPLPSEEERHNEWMAARDDTWREFREKYAVEKKEAA